MELGETPNLNLLVCKLINTRSVYLLLSNIARAI